MNTDGLEKIYSEKHYEMAGYGSAQTWARQLGREEAANLLEETLEEEKEADVELTEIAETLVNPEAGGSAEEDEEEEEEEDEEDEGDDEETVEDEDEDLEDEEDFDEDEEDVTEEEEIKSEPSQSSDGKGSSTGERSVERRQKRK